MMGKCNVLLNSFVIYGNSIENLLITSSPCLQPSR
ncbi:hypothetical protein T05_12351 [Trichinella murrelli]|uniref:Uncharacterized protein n=1 Tax=Trichinella murrelli TaxID=144512 RepID=A0A0V0SV09_9BILA|nr:hypothetical protein T05_12351 [Trichinella murrelli]